jgi:hypothetical protein
LAALYAKEGAMKPVRYAFALAAVAALAFLAACGGGGEAGTDYPAAGEDRFERTTATVQIEIIAEGASAGLQRLQELETVALEGPALVTRGDPQRDGDIYSVKTEIVEMELSGPASFGPVIVRESPDKQSTGEVRQQEPGQDFPADSFFDIFVEIELPDLGLTLHNEEGLRMSAELSDLPPGDGDSYRGEDDRPLYTPAGLQVGRIVDALHIPNPPEATEEPEATETEEPAGPTATEPAGGPEQVEITQTEGCEHTQPGVQSELQKLVTVRRPDGTPVEGANVLASATGPGLLSPTAQGTTNGEGQAQLVWPINKFGSYGVAIEGVTDASGAALELTPTSETTATIEVGEVCESPFTG